MSIAKTIFETDTHQTQSQRATISKEKLHLIEQVFQLADEGSKNFLNLEDLKVAIMALFGYKPSKDEVTEMLNNYGLNLTSNSGLTRKQFERSVVPKFAAVDEDEEIRNTFTAFDANCRGFLTLDDVKKVFSQVCPRMSEDRVEMAFREIDLDEDGRVSYKDFDFMMKFNNFS